MLHKEKKRSMERN